MTGRIPVGVIGGTGYVAGETLATEFAYGDPGDGAFTVDVDGRSLAFTIRVTEPA